jgi:putative acetyltransferase
MTINYRTRLFNQSDLEECIALFRETVHNVNSKDYSQAQVDVWAPRTIDKYNWNRRLSENITYVVEYDKQILGFANLTPLGLLDLMYVHKDFQRQGVATVLLRKLEEQAKNSGLKEIFLEASVTAKTFFERLGYHVESAQNKELRGVKFDNFIMKKLIS